MKITVLAENTSCDPKIGCEHGLSLFIETAKHKILFDSGQSGLFAENAATLGADLSGADIAVLSHGHYDHGGGLLRFLELNSKAPVYLSRYAFEPHYNGTEKYIGLDPRLKNSARLIFTDDDLRIDDELSLCSCNDRDRVAELDSAGLKLLENGEFVPEDFRHEQYLLINEGGSRTLISGCSHKGILNIVEWFKPDVLIGGFHYMKHPCDGELRSFAEILNAYPTEYYTCHCTGVEQFGFMKPYLKRAKYISAGTVFTV